MILSLRREGSGLPEFSPPGACLHSRARPLVIAFGMAEQPLHGVSLGGREPRLLSRARPCRLCADFQGALLGGREPRLLSRARPWNHALRSSASLRHGTRTPSREPSENYCHCCLFCKVNPAALLPQSLELLVRSRRRSRIHLPSCEHAAYSVLMLGRLAKKKKLITWPSSARDIA